MLWPPMIFNLCVGLLLAGYLLRGVRRFERRADTVMDELDRRHKERMQRLETERAEMQRAMRSSVDQMIEASRTQLETARAELPPMTRHEPGDRLPHSDTDPSDGPVPTQPIEH